MPRLGVTSRGVPGQCELELVRLPRVANRAGGCRRAVEWRHRHRGMASRRQVRRNHRHHFIQRERPGRCDHDIIPEMMAVAECHQRLPVNRGDRLQRPGNRISQRMLAPQRAGNEVPDMICRRFLIHRDFLADDLALQTDLRFGKRGMPDHVRQHVREHRHQVRLTAAFVNGLVLRGAGVELAACVFDLEAELPRTSPRRSFKNHVLHEMRQSRRQVRLIAAARRDIDRQCRAFGIRHRCHGQAWAVRELPPFVDCLAHRKIASASAKSAGVVIFRFHPVDSTNFTRTPRISIADTSSVTASPCAATAA